VDSTKRNLRAAGIAFVCLYTFPYFFQLRSANELPRVLLTEEIVDHHTFRIDRRVGELGSTFDVAVTPDGHRYSNKAPGSSFLAVPGYAILKIFDRHPSIKAATWVCRVTAATIPALIFLPFFLGFARRMGSERGGDAAFVAYALGSMALPYAILFFSHQLAAACAGGAFLCAVRLRAGGRDLGAVACGLLAGASILVDYQSAIAALVVGIYLLVVSPSRIKHAALALAGTIPPVLLLLLYHKACFGHAFKTGYSYAMDPAHKHGVLGIIGPNRVAMWNALLAPDNGLITLMPWVLLAIPGFAWLWRRRPELRAEAVACAAIAVLYVLFIGSLVPEFGRAGWSVGPRYITVALPFLAWLAAAGLEAAERHELLRAGAHALVLVGVVVFVVAATTYPHWPTGFTNPLYEVSFKLLRLGKAPHSLGTAVGLRGLLSIAPLYVVALALAGSTLGWRRSTALAAALAVGIVAAYALFPRHGGREKLAFIVSEWEPR
jgi:hypothetical protein